MIRVAFRLVLLIVMTALAGTQSAWSQDHFRIGVIAPLSGALAEYGLAARNGIELARTEHSELFSNIDFIYEDSQWDAKTAVSAFNQLRDSQRVSLIYNWGNPTTEAVAPIAERSHVPLLGMTLDPRVARSAKYVIRSTNSAADFAAAMAEYLRKSGYKTIGVVLAENTYVEGLLDGLTNALGDTVTVHVVDRYNIQDQDFRASVTKIAAGKFDAVGVFLISGQVSTFYRQLIAQKVALPTFGTDFFESTTEIRLAKGGMNGAVYPHLGITDDFRRAYVTKFANDYQIAYAGNAYDMAITIGKLFHRDTSTPTAEEIMTRLQHVQGKTGVGGTFEYRDDPEAGPHFHFPVQLKKIVGEKIEILKSGK